MGVVNVEFNKEESGDIMDGVTNLVREFSSNFNDLTKEWKYTVEMYDEGIEIKHWDSRDGEMKERERLNISTSCAELLFKTIAKDFENRAFDI